MRPERIKSGASESGGKEKGKKRKYKVKKMSGEKERERTRKVKCCPLQQINKEESKGKQDNDKVGFHKLWVQAVIYFFCLIFFLSSSCDGGGCCAFQEMAA